MRNTLRCYVCKQDFPREEIVAYASPNATILHNYCHKCLLEKQEKDKFYQEICIIFGLKSPGPVILTQRKRLKKEYGYTDEIILKTLKYMFEVENKKKLSESLYFVTPENVNKMLKYERSQQYKAYSVAAATRQELPHILVKTREASEESSDFIDVDKLLEE